MKFKLGHKKEDNDRLINGESGGNSMTGISTEEALKRGMNAGADRGRMYWGDLDSLGNANQEQLKRLGQQSKGYQEGEGAALKAAARAEAQSSLQRGNIQAGAQGLKGVASAKQAQNTANQMGQFNRGMAMDEAQLVRSGTQNYFDALRTGISQVESQRIAEGGLRANMVSGQNIANVSTQPANRGGTVICTELHAQGYLSDEILEKDKTHGILTHIYEPNVYLGYQIVGPKIVRLMQKSKTFTSMVAFFAVPWAKDMAGEKNLIGSMVNFFGRPFCSLVYKVYGGKIYGRV